MKIKLNDLNSTFQKLRPKLGDRQYVIEEIIEKVTEFENNLRDKQKTVFEIEKKIEPLFLKPQPKTGDKVKEEIEYVTSFLDQLNSPLLELDNEYIIGDWLMGKSSRDPCTVQDIQVRLNEVKNPKEKLIKKLSNYKTQLAENLQQFQELSEKLNSFEEKILMVEEQLSSLKPISAKFTVARAQQEQFKVCV